jgi:hypothetical protein
MRNTPVFLTNYHFVLASFLHFIAGLQRRILPLGMRGGIVQSQRWPRENVKFDDNCYAVLIKASGRVEISE